jgi:hypothetical protein
MKINKEDNILHWIISEASFFTFLYYVQYLLGVDTNILYSTFILWALLNILIIFCPVINKCYK